MANRETKVTLSLQMQEYVAGMKKAAGATRDLHVEGQRLAQMREDFDRLGRAGVVAGGVIAAGMALAVSKFAEFDQAMSNVKAATGESADSMAALTEAAVEAGSETVFSATEAANAIEELGKAGVETADILSGGLDAALDLASAGGIGVAEAAGIAATALKQFNLEGEDMGRVADLLAAGAGKAMGDVTDLSQALSQVGGVANSTGLTIEETTTALAAFASQSLLGSDAGTSFKAMLGALTPNSKQAAAEMERLGISAFDAGGKFVGLEALAGNLQSSLSGLTDEQRQASLEVIFGSDAVRAATALYNEGAEGIRDWSDALDDQGYAARTAATRLDNLRGDVEALGGAIDAALIETGSYANDAARGLIQAATGIVGAFNDAPQPVQATAIALGAVAASIGLVGGAALLAVPKWAQFTAAVSASGTSIKSVAKSAGLAGIALAGIGAIITEIGKDQAAAQQRAEDYATTLEEGSQRITKATREMAEQNLATKRSFFFVEMESAYDAAEKLGIELDLVTDAALGNENALRRLSVELEAANDGSFELGNAYATVNDAVKGQSSSLEEAIRVSEQRNRVSADGEKVVRDEADAYLDAADDADEYTNKLSALVDAMNELNGAGQSAASANLAFKDALADVDATIQNARDGADGYALGLDDSTQAGRDNLAMLIDLAEKSQDAAESQFDLDQNTKAYEKALRDGRQALIERAEDLGATADEAEDLADSIYGIPDKTEFEVIAKTQAAEAAMQRLTAALNYVDTTDPVLVVSQVGGGISRRATGGAIYGPGSGTSDTAGLFALSNGEHVLTAADVAAMGGQHAVYAFRTGLHDSGAAGSSAVGDTIEIVNNNYAVPGMSAEQVGRIAAEKTAFALRRN